MHVTSATTPSVALVGNPNTGKTTIFNALTGLNLQVGNYPGVTVEHAVGTMRRAIAPVEIVDLPGTYSLAARSPDELVAVDVLLGQVRGQEPIRAIVVVLDAGNLGRNLYLASQLLELGRPVVAVLNMTDVARRRGIAIDAPALERELGVPVVPVRGDKREGLDALREAISRAAEKGEAPATRRPVRLPKELIEQTDALHATLLAEREKLGREVPWIEAFRALVDNEGEAAVRLVARLGPDFARRLAECRLAVGTERPLAALEAAARYAWVNELTRRVVKHPDSPVRTWSDRIDNVLTHRLFGTLSLALILAVIFQAIYTGAGPLMDLVTAGTDTLADGARAILPEGPLQSLVVDGAIAGVGAVVVFLPQILLLFFFVALLEDCGYMARAAFLMDKLLTRLGLSGQAVIPLLSSFACAVPGVMAARSIGNRRDRIATILVAPLMSCSARLPVYVLMIGAFVPAERWLFGIVGLQGSVLFAAHLIGILVAIPTVLIFKKTLLSGPVPAFVMELPEYRMPTFSNVSRRLYSQGKDFLLRAGTIILAFSIVVWALSYYPRPEWVGERFDAARAAATSEAELAEIEHAESQAYIEQSFMGRAGQAIEPIVEPLGWDWRIGMASIASIPAREVVIATLGTILGVGDQVDEESEALSAKMKRATWPDGRPLFDLPVALSLIVFFALCCQCVSTLAVIKRETGSYGWMILAFTYMSVLAYIGALVTYQVARALLGS